MPSKMATATPTPSPPAGKTTEDEGEGHGWTQSVAAPSSSYTDSAEALPTWRGPGRHDRPDGQNPLTLTGRLVTVRGRGRQRRGGIAGFGRLMREAVVAIRPAGVPASGNRGGRPS
jgi:hypothetical protein